jgi:hypothetical protein
MIHVSILTYFVYTIMLAYSIFIFLSSYDELAN